MRLRDADIFSDVVSRKGRLLGVLLDELVARRPTAVAAVRRSGLLAALELRPPPDGCGLLLSYLHHQGLYAYAAAQLLAERHGVLVLPALGSGQTLRLAPPLTVSEDEIRAALAGLDDVLATLEAGDTAAVARALHATAPRHTGPGALTQPRLVLPPPPRVRDGRSRYAFLVHYTDLRDVTTTDPGLSRLSRDELQAFVGWSARLPPGVLLHGPRLRTPSGAEVDGYILALSLLPEQMLRLGRRRVRAAIEQAVDLAASLGASIVGLGGFTTPYSSRGLDVRGRGPGITTGNALTAVMAVRALQKALQQADFPTVPLRARALSEASVAIVGARGSVGALCARLLARERPARLWLIGHAGSDLQRLRALADEISWGAGTVEVETHLGPLARCSVVVSASGAGRPILDGAALTPGTLIADMARPFDASPALRARRDVLVLDGGLVALPDPSLRFGVGNLQGLPDGVQLACLSETLLLALAGHRGDFSIGDDISLEQADHIAALAAQHGFELAPLPGPRSHAPRLDPGAEAVA